MKVKELIEELQKLPQDAEVIMSSDPEGNSYSPLADVNPGTIPPEDVNKYSIDSFYSDAHTDGQCWLGPGERETFTKVVCFFPTN